MGMLLVDSPTVAHPDTAQLVLERCLAGSATRLARPAAESQARHRIVAWAQEPHLTACLVELRVRQRLPVARQDVLVRSAVRIPDRWVQGTDLRGCSEHLAQAQGMVFHPLRHLGRSA